MQLCLDIQCLNDRDLPLIYNFHSVFKILFVNKFSKSVKLPKQLGRIHGSIGRVLLGRGSKKAVYTSMGAHCIITDRLQR